MGAGIFSIFRLNQELLPSIEFPSVFIVTSDPGANPAVIDRDINIPLSNALNGLPHAQHVFATSSQSFSQVQVQFNVDSNTKDDLDAVNQRLGQGQRPPGAGNPPGQTFPFSAPPTTAYSLGPSAGNP